MPLISNYKHGGRRWEEITPTTQDDANTRKWGKSSLSDSNGRQHADNDGKRAPEDSRQYQ
jgi:hypothetical protein